MAEEAQARVQKSVENLVNDLDKSCIRKLQGDMHRCAAKCCEDTNSSMEGVHHCIENCSKRVADAQTFIQNELTNFQDRLQRCALQCQDNIRDKIGANTTESQLSSFKGDYEKCVVACADSHVNLIPSLLKRMKETLCVEKV